VRAQSTGAPLDAAALERVLATPSVGLTQPRDFIEIRDFFLHPPGLLRHERCGDTKYLTGKAPRREAVSRTADGGRRAAREPLGAWVDQ
jgi:hypothetical protein